VVDALPQGTNLFFKITAGNPLLWTSSPAVLRGCFTTGTVNAEIVVDWVTVRSDSDSLSEGDLTFLFFAGDSETMTAIPAAINVYQNELSDNETARVDR
jgi:hypothetical protein